MKIGTYTLSEGSPAIMGVVNATPDSFSDGGLCLHPEAAVERSIKLFEDGADIVDVGGESTRPGADPVTVDEELKRVIPIIEGVRSVTDRPISIDTAKSEVAKQAVEAGANMINDISAGKFDEGMYRVAANSGVPICLMHIKGTPRDMQNAPSYVDLVGEVREYLKDAVEAAVGAGVSRDRILVDPGVGFGKTVEDNLELIRRLDEFKGLHSSILIGTSRKSFIGKMLNMEVNDRLEGTLATLAASINHGAQILRVHDVAAARKFVTMYLACM
jgi:dihydropteroate synthase